MVKKDAYLPKHQHITDVPNLVVMMVVKSLKSKGFLDEVFSWQWSYYFVNEAGVKFLAKTLGKLSSLIWQAYLKMLFPRLTREPRLADQQRVKTVKERVKRLTMRSLKPT